MSDAMQQDIGRRINAVIEQGRAETADFDERSALIVALGAGERPEFMRAIAMLPASHRVVTALADDPGEAMRVLSLPAREMTVELAKLAVKAAVAPLAKATAPASAAPKAAGGEMSSRDFIELRNKADRERRSEPGVSKRAEVSDAELRGLTGRAYIEARNKSAPRHLGGRWR